MINRCKSCEEIIGNKAEYCKCCSYIENEDRLEVEEQITKLDCEEELLLDEGQKRKASQVRKQIKKLQEQIKDEPED